MTYAYKWLLVKEIGHGIYHVQMNRVKQLNALNQELWGELEDVFRKLDTDHDCRAIILSGNGRAFTSGIDLAAFSSDLTQTLNPELDVLRAGEKMSVAFTLMEKCCKPVIAAVHNYCIGGGVDITSACDIRYCTNDAKFSVKETVVGFAADMGSLNRLPKIVGNHSWMREVAMTGRDFSAKEALDQGYVSRVFDTYDEMLSAAKETAKLLATNSPVAVQGTKIVLNYSRDHPVDDSLRYVAMWNMSQIQTDDLAESAMAIMSKGPKPNYAKL